MNLIEQCQIMRSWLCDGIDPRPFGQDEARARACFRVLSSMPEVIVDGTST